MSKYLTHLIFAYALTFLSIEAKGLRCYICKGGCDETDGFLFECNKTREDAFCYRYSVNSSQLAIYEETRIKSKLSPVDVKHFKDPKAYRDCGYNSDVDIGQNNHTFAWTWKNVGNDTVPKYVKICHEFEKFECVFCEKDGCNKGPRALSLQELILFLIVICAITF